MSFEAVVLPGYQARLVEIQASVAHLRLGQMLAFAILCAAITAILLLGFLAFTRRSVPLPYSLLPLPALVCSGRELRRGAGTSGEEYKGNQHRTSKIYICSGRARSSNSCVLAELKSGGAPLPVICWIPAHLQEVTERQAVVHEFRSRADLRERIGLLGELVVGQFENPAWVEKT